MLNRLDVGWVDEVADAAGNGGDVELSLENVGNLNCDVLSVVTAFLADGAPQPEELSVLENLAVQRAGQVVKIDASFFGVNYVTYAALAARLTEALRAIEPIAVDLV